MEEFEKEDKLELESQTARLVEEALLFYDQEIQNFE